MEALYELRLRLGIQSAPLSGEPPEEDTLNHSRANDAPLRPLTLDLSESLSLSLTSLLKQRELLGVARTSAIGQRLIPTSSLGPLQESSSRVYSGQFSDDGSLFYSATHNNMVHIYKVDGNMGFTKHKAIRGGQFRWTITDCAMTTDNRFLAHSSITPVIYLAHVDGSEQQSIPIKLSEDFGLGIWSVRFSHDSREIVVGTNSGTIIVYDLQSQRKVNEYMAHSSDINSVCFADATAPNVIFSGSDDTFVKVWDRRMFSSDTCGVLSGHSEGITFVSSKNDGRNCISNGKDQTLRLWDIRKMHTGESAVRACKIETRSGFDYRWHGYRFVPGSRKHPMDCSVATYMGHRVLHTLIRCYFSPLHTTGQRFIYTGSSNGRIHIFDSHDTSTSKPVHVFSAIPKRFRRLHEPHHDPYSSFDPTSDPNICTRDVSWHPYLPFIISSNWGTITPGTAGSLGLHTFRRSC
ncbi:putative LEC14B protein [Polychytrium aggregatum]|uniref:putative LEC14B protein n=1 Tax=Polychytrium aggregatum TaxID=110093 RepID=UPI0022FE9D2F|nr:putative LEC14B protein [Polychytrium aggregatum]KAI9202815.1 putative LEC14B protein [Polychytrium aggregatum]